MPEQRRNIEYTALTNASLLALLQERALDCGQKSMTARLAVVIEIVEAILARGYDRSQVLALLTEAGWRFTPDSFDSALSRVRRRRLLNVDGNRRRSEKLPSLGCSDSPPTFADVFASPRSNWKGSGSS